MRGIYDKYDDDMYDYCRMMIKMMIKMMMMISVIITNVSIVSIVGSLGLIFTAHLDIVLRRELYDGKSTLSTG